MMPGAHNNSNKGATVPTNGALAQRMAELNRWQEEQKRMLAERQNEQRLRLDVEQRTMYEMLGLMQMCDLQKTHDDTDAYEEDDDVEQVEAYTEAAQIESVHSEDDDDYNEQMEAYEHEAMTLNKDDNNNKNKQNDYDGYDEPLTNSCHIGAATLNTQRSSGYGSETGIQQTMPSPLVAPTTLGKAKPVRQFLRCGAGLKQRFKIDPNQLRLENLPRYKFANAHPHLKLPKQKKRGILKQEQQKPKLIPAKKPEIELPPLDLHEKRFQQLLISGRATCNSTPETKSTITTNAEYSAGTSNTVSPKVRFVEIEQPNQQMQQQPQRDTMPLRDDISSTSTVPSLQGVTWAQVLNSQNIKPVQVRRQLENAAMVPVPDEENISIFELLEQKAREGNIDMNSTCIRAFMARKEKRLVAAADETADIIPVPEQLRQKHITPLMQHEEYENETNIPIEYSGTNTSETIDSNHSTPLQAAKAHLHVRFSDSNDTHEYVDETTMSETSTLAADDTNDNVALFEQFKAALFTALDQKKAQAEAAMQQSNEADSLSNVLQEKANLVKTRLSELEAEIEMFKENNAQLLRLKQVHELDKAQLAQEHADAMERLHEEKIQFELYMHDERVKLDEERRRFEQQMKLQKANLNTKDKRELANLKQDVETLQAQLKQKEQTHVAAQARLRAQLRALEKEQKTFYEQIEDLNKENKRLQSEAMKVGRENNNKMLQEINRNIARLAPKLNPAAPAEQPVEAQPTTRRTKSFGGQMSNNQTHKHNAAKSQRHSGYGVVSNCRAAHSKSRQKYDTPNDSTTSTDSDTLEELDDQLDDDALCEELTLATKKSTKNKSPKIIKQKTPEKSTEPAAPKPVANTSTNAEHNNTQEFKREIVNADGSKDIWYPNGNLKKISSDGMIVRMLYFNKDIKETDIRAGTIKYYYAETNTWHTTYLDGLEILEFPNGQTEHRHKSGVVEIHFPNNTIKIVDPSDEHKLEEWRYADGTHLVQMRNGDKILSLPNGQKEIHTKLNKRREYPDGTVKLVYPDGSQETRYSNGRVRLKDKDGKLIMDTDMAKY